MTSITCAFCAEPATGYCKWPVEVFRTVKYRELAVGDTVRRAIDRLKRRPPATVTELTPYDDRVTVEILMRRSSRAKFRAVFKRFQVKAQSPVQRLGESPCGMPVCEAHLRRVEEGVEYCRDHWRAWECVA